MLPLGQLPIHAGLQDERPATGKGRGMLCRLFGSAICMLESQVHTSRVRTLCARFSDGGRRKRRKVIARVLVADDDELWRLSRLAATPSYAS